MTTKRQSLQTYTYVIISIVLTIYLLKSASFILIPLAWGAFLAVAMSPICDWLERIHLSRKLAAFASLAIVTVIASIILYVLINQVSGLLANTEVLKEKLETFLVSVQTFLTDLIGPAAETGSNSWNLSELMYSSNLGGLIETTGQTILILSIIPVYVFFLLYYRDFFYEFLLRINKGLHQEPYGWLKVGSIMIQNYLAGLMIVTVIVAIMAGIVFYLLGIQYFLFFALFVAIFNLIPFIGVILSSAVSVLYVMLVSESLWYPLLTMVLLWGIQMIENNLITPLIVGAKIRLNPLAVVLAIMIGGWVWGISGIVLFIPILGVVKIIFDRVDYLNPYGYLLGTYNPN